MSEELSRGRLRKRYNFTGRLIMDTALHIGGGRESPGASDSPIVRDAAGRPFVPGSSFKGAFRAAVERIVPNLGLRTCALADGYAECLSTDKPDEQTGRSSLDQAYRLVRGALGRRLDGASQEVRRGLSRLNRPDLAGQMITDEHLLALLDALLCDTCKVFGSVHLASAVHVEDLPVEEPWYEVVQVRDGVGIDRDSERAKERIKYDFEAVPPQTAFRFNLTVESASPKDLGLVALGLHEFLEGVVPIGGIRTRGLGRCHLDDLRLEVVDFEDPKALRAYLTRTERPDQDALPDARPFVAVQIETLLRAQGV